MDSKIAWTPEEIEATALGVLIDPPKAPLTEEAYLALLEQRFRGLVRQAKAAGADPWAMAQEPMAKWDGLTPNSDREIPAMLARQSETLKTMMPLHQCPIAPQAIKDSEMARQQISLAQFSDLLAAVYPTA